VSSRPVLAAALMAASCAHAPASDPQVPEYAPKDQTSAAAAKSSSRPLILEWPAADRAALEALRGSGVVVVRYGNREMEVLRGCRVAASYRYVPLTPKEEDLVLRDASELEATMPIHTATLEARLAHKQRLEVAMMIVGEYETEPRAWAGADLRGSCDGATHVIQALTVGAFEVAASAEEREGAGAKVMGFGVDARHDASREVLHRDGTKEACTKGAARDPSPPSGCGALLRVEVTPIHFAVASSGGVAACPGSTVRKGDTCEAVAPDRPPLLDVLQGQAR
jgi:hypothetical protein